MSTPGYRFHIFCRVQGILADIRPQVKEARSGFKTVQPVQRIRLLDGIGFCPLQRAEIVHGEAYGLPFDVDAGVTSLQSVKRDRESGQDIREK